MSLGLDGGNLLLTNRNGFESWRTLQLTEDSSALKGNAAKTKNKLNWSLPDSYRLMAYHLICATLNVLLGRSGLLGQGLDPGGLTVAPECSPQTFNICNMYNEQETH